MSHSIQLAYFFFFLFGPCSVLKIFWISCQDLKIGRFLIKFQISGFSWEKKNLKIWQDWDHIPTWQQMTGVKLQPPGPSLFERSHACQLALCPPCSVMPDHLCPDWFWIECLTNPQDSSPQAGYETEDFLGSLGIKGSFWNGKEAFHTFLRNFAFILWACGETMSSLKVIMINSFF